MTGDLLDRIDGARTVLVQAPPLGAHRGVCASLLAGSAAPSVLFVTYTRGASDCLGRVEGTPTEEVGVITVGGSLGADSVEGVDRTERVESPGDLTGLGIAIDGVLSAWEPPVTVCFESLTALLQYVPFETAYEFAHTITGRAYAADARIHFHVDPDAHDRQEIAGLASLFDASVTPAEDRVRVRETLG
jgi:hypothetical protein